MNLVHDLIQAAVIMTLGMAVTFAFLALLIIMVQLASRIILKYAHVAAPSRNDIQVPQQLDENGAIIAAIAMAAKKYHSEHNKKNRRFYASFKNHRTCS